MKGEPGGSPAGARLTPETSTFRKQRRAAPPGFFAAEAAGLRWLRVAGGPRVVSVLSVDDDGIELERLIPRGGPTLDAARRFGGALARLHDSLDDAAWGAAPVQPAYFGPLDNPLPMAVGAFDTWVEFYAEARLRVIVEQGLARGVFTPADSAAFDAVCGRLPELIGPAANDRPARLHGDLWAGNVIWTPEAVLIDPAAHAGHRESDLAMLALFGAPYLSEIIASYQEGRPLAPGWRERVALHQLYPLAVHAVLFGGEYVTQTRAVLQALVRPR